MGTDRPFLLPPYPPQLLTFNTRARFVFVSYVFRARDNNSTSTRRDRRRLRDERLNVFENRSGARKQKYPGAMRSFENDTALLPSRFQILQDIRRT